ncbi:hypothetical protein [Polaribacter sp. ALD11]|uniref:hypothetical protein n=1 Tax=Polaribacter sp. ALD11 TaxID=2058137 RepID=UPI0012FD12B6|nr:hypothetical protein [Polaribacter sp. ALD11]
MKLDRFIRHTFILILCIPLFLNCSKEDICTKKVNIPLWDENKKVFVDNFQDLPCDFNGTAKSLSEFTFNEKKELLVNFQNKETVRVLIH